MHLNDFFDKIYCINLADRKDKWDKCQTIFKKNNIKVERFEAINGFKSKHKPGEPPYPGWTKISQGNVGCLLSHMDILQIARKKLLKNVLILEDDVDFVENFSELSSRYISYIPDKWDMIYFGGNYSFGKINYDPIPINQYVAKASLILGTHAVGIKSTMFNGLISDLLGLKMPVDLYYSSYMSFCNCYTPTQNLAFQRKTFSDIEQKIVDNQHLYS